MFIDLYNLAGLREKSADLLRRCSFGNNMTRKKFKGEYRYE